MKDGNDLPRISKLLKEKGTIAICLPQQTTLDAAAAALALYSALVKSGKSVSISAPEPLNPDFGLLEQDKIKNTVSADGNVLVVSVPFKDFGIENVTYNVENDRVNIVIKPEEGAARFDPSKVEYNYTGGKPELVVTVYAPTLDALGSLYQNNIEQFQGVEILNIDRHFTNSQFGTVNYVDKKSPSMSQMVNEILRDMRFEMTKEVATYLFTGLSSATNNFSAHTVNAQTFKMAAMLLERGAEKQASRPAMYPSQSLKSFGPMSYAPPAGMNMPGMNLGQPALDPYDDYPAPFDQPPAGVQLNQPQQQPRQQRNGPPQQQQQPRRNVIPQQSVEQAMMNEMPMKQSGSAEHKEAPLPQMSQDDSMQQEDFGNDNQPDPQDWLKPQIFKGNQGTPRV